MIFMILHHYGVTLFTVCLPLPISICSLGGIEMETGTDGFQDAPDMDRRAPLELHLSSEPFMPPVNLEPHMHGLYSSDSMLAEMPVSPCTTDKQYWASTPITPMEEQGSPFPAKTGKPEVQCDRSIGERVTVQNKLPSYCTCSRHRSGVQYLVIDCSPFHLSLSLSPSPSPSPSLSPAFFFVYAGQTTKEDGGCYCMVAESLNSISWLGNFGATPLPSPFPVQEIVHPLDPVSCLAC